MSVDVHHTLEGPDDAAVVVFSNSLGTTGVMWDAQAAALSDRFRVLRYDARGHGSTPATRGPYTMGDLAGDVIDLIDRLELERVSFCGLSIGGMTGMWLGVNAPERIDRLAICCTGDAAAAGGDVDGARGPGTGGGNGLRDRRDHGALVHAGVPGAQPRGRRPDPRDLPDHEPRGIRGLLRGAGASSTCAASWTQSTAPTLVIAGEDDPVGTPERAGAVGEEIEGSRRRRPARGAAPGRGGAGRRGDPRARAAPRRGGGQVSDEHERGMEVRREVLGDEYVDSAVESTTEFTQDFQDLITRYAWGEIWTRPGLDRRMRSAITLTALIALGHFDELAMHVRAARRNGLGDDEIKEVLLQSAIYCGVPAANRAFAVASRGARGGPGQ